MSRTVPQQSYAAVSGAGYDQCWTPPHAVTPLLPYLPSGARIWECAAGAGWLARWLRDAGYRTLESDVTTGQDFFHYQPSEPWDVLVTNVPFSLKYKFLERAYALGKPFALLVPYSTVFASTAKKIRDVNGDNWEELRLNRRINFYMPGSGYHNNGAQLSTMWLCHGLLPQSVIDADVPDAAPEHRLIKPPKKVKPTRADVVRWVLASGARTPEQIADLIVQAMKGGVPIERQITMFESEAA